MKQNLQRKEVPRRYLFSFAKTPNEIAPKRRTKLRQNAEKNSAKSPKRPRKRGLQISRKAGMLSEKMLGSEVAYALTLG